MDYKLREKVIADMLKLAPVEWPGFLVKLRGKHKFSASDMDDLRRAMDDNCERLAFLSEYITRRFGCDGCGEKDPVYAVKKAQKRQEKITHALGYYTQYRRPFFTSCSPEE